MNQARLKPEPCAAGSFKGYYKLDWINSVAQRATDTVFGNLIHHVNEENLTRAFQGLDGSKASGIDRMTKAEYGKNLQSNIELLSQEISRGGWRPRPSREVLIPKPTGGKRPLAIGCLEDKIVQALVAKILEAIYEPLFHRESYGFRPNRSAHQALSSAHRAISRHGKDTVVVEMDIEKFFNNIDHDKMVTFLEQKISDKALLRLIKRMLRNSILSADGSLIDNATGTPQGSPVSPILANIYLHYVLDKWFDENYIGHAKMVRYADDAVFVFDDRQRAEKFQNAMIARFNEFGLKLNLEKSGLVELQPKKGTIITFLGFDLYWGRAGLGKTVLRFRTTAKRLARATQAFCDWIKDARSRFPTREIWKRAIARLQGHYNYYGVIFNSNAIYKFYKSCIWNLFKWLNRRSQKASFTWEAFKRKLWFKPLRRPPLGFELLDLTSISGTKSKHKPKSRMRKSRPSGSARSSGRQRSLFT